MDHIKLPALAAAFVIGIGFLQIASAQSTYPSKPIRLVVPFPAGGPTDVFARQVGVRLSTLIAQPVVIDNKAGASGAIGSVDVKRSAPDGYTLLFGTASTHGLYNLIVKSPQYDALKDFAHIAILGGAPVVFAVHPSMPKTLKGVVDLARAKPGLIQYGSPGEGTYLHLAAERLKNEAGKIDIQHIPYKGSAQTLPALIGGHIAMSVDTLGSALPGHQAGKLRILAIATTKRSPLAPELPTVDEAIRITGFEAVLWNTLAAPAATPAPILGTLSAALSKVMRDTALHEQLARLAIQPTIDSSPAMANAYIKAEMAKWKPVVEATGIKLD
jgi:tripartite-type tricarboxylate transporter receptor subunit TctC